MKKDRNCGGAMPYPMYPSYPGMMMNQGMMPMNPGVMTIPNMPMNTMAQNAFNTTPNFMIQSGVSGGTIEQQLSCLILMLLKYMI